MAHSSHGQKVMQISTENGISTVLSSVDFNKVGVPPKVMEDIQKVQTVDEERSKALFDNLSDEKAGN